MCFAIYVLLMASCVFLLPFMKFKISLRNSGTNKAESSFKIRQRLNKATLLTCMGEMG